jgi:hypothetical protein
VSTDEITIRSERQENLVAPKKRKADLELKASAYDDPDRDRDPTEPVTGTYQEVDSQDPEAKP